MPKNLLQLSVSAPGFRGLNLEQAGDILDPNWATVAENLIFDSVGRLAARNGTKDITTGTAAVQEVIFEYNSGVGQTIISAGNNLLQKVEGTALTDITGSVTVSADNWKFQNFNEKMYRSRLSSIFRPMDKE